MSTSQHAEFIERHENQIGKTFNMQQELFDYCLIDVNILKNGCLLYRKLYMNITNK